MCSYSASVSFAKHVVVDADFADVVQQPAEIERAKRVLVAIHFFRDCMRQCHAFAMAARIRVFGVNRELIARTTPPKSSACSFVDVAAVDAEYRADRRE